MPAFFTLGYNHLFMFLSLTESLQDCIFFHFGSLAKISQLGTKEIKIWFGKVNRHQDTRVDGLFREQVTALPVWKENSSHLKGKLNRSHLDNIQIKCFGKILSI